MWDKGTVLLSHFSPAKPPYSAIHRKKPLSRLFSPVCILPHSSSPVNPKPAETTRSGSSLNMALTDW